MIFWSRKKRRYPLPKFPDTVIPTFRGLCEVVHPDSLDELYAAIAHTERVIAQEAEEDEGLDVETYQDLIEACKFLLDQYENVDDKGRAAIVGAVRYFVVGDDPFHDSIFATGLYDDQRIINYVLEELGIHDRYLKEN